MSERVVKIAPMRASVVLLTYNQERFVAEAITAAFAQTYRPLEIVISDDASSDGTWPIIERLAAQAPRGVAVSINRNSERAGIGGNFQIAAQLTHGELIVAAAGDDVARPDRVARLVELFAPGVFVVGSQLRIIDDDGTVITESTALPWPRCARDAINTILRGAAAAYRREVFDLFPPMSRAVMYEDYVLPLRAALIGRIAFCNQALVDYRVHANGFSNLCLGSYGKGHAKNMATARQAQAADIKHAAAKGLIAADTAEELLEYLRPLSGMAAFEAAVAYKRLRTLPLAVAARRAGNNWRDIARATIRLGAPWLWRVYRGA